MKKFIVPFIIFFGIIVVIFIVFSRSQTKTPQTIPTPTGKITQTIPVTYFNDIIPGSSAESAVIKSMGPPIRRDQINGQTTLVYPSGLGTRPINVNVDTAGVVTLIVEPVGTTVRLSQIIGTYGQPDVTLYGAFNYLGFQLKIYLSRGFAVLANPQTQEVRERWYFPPQTANGFLSTYGHGYSTQPIKEQE